MSDQRNEPRAAWLVKELESGLQEFVCSACIAKARGKTEDRQQGKQVPVHRTADAGERARERGGTCAWCAWPLMRSPG